MTSLRDMSRRLPTRIKAFDLAYQNYRLTLRLFHYIDRGELDKRYFTDAIEMMEGGSSIVLPAEEFADEQLVKDTMHQVGSDMFGRVFTALGDIVDSRYGKELAKIPDEARDVCLLIWSVRNAYAHQVGTPIWHTRKPDNRRIVCAGPITVDLAELEGQFLDYSQLGGANCIETVWGELQARL